VHKNRRRALCGRPVLRMLTHANTTTTEEGGQER
jgi:hypothetical protein